MSFPALFISRPIATTLLTLGLALSGIVAFFLLPVAPLPNTDFPVISVSASMPGASPQTMSTSVATPLERHLGAIADVNEMTSQSSVGSTRITLQFNIDRDIDGAARDVQAAINAARVDLPASLRANPTYRKINPADAPILILALTSKTLSGGQIYDSASTVLQQMLSQVAGVGDVTVGGSSLPAVRVELNPRALFKFGIGLEDVRAALSAANADSPKGAVQDRNRRYQLYVNDTAGAAKDYRDIIVAWRNNAPVRVGDIATVSDGVENIRNLGLANGREAILLLISKQPGANVIETVDRIRALVPTMQGAIPPTIHLSVVMDTTTTIRASVRDVERTLVIATGLVLLVVFFFLRTARAALIPSVAVPLSLIGTFAVMYLLGFSLDNFSLMALTISTGFVIDDAIVVLENITRHIEAGMPRFKAAMLGASEVSFTVLAMSLSLIAVFLPILLMGGLVGRLFHEFAVTLSTAIVVSLLISLTTTPMMCAFLTVTSTPASENRVMRGARRLFEEMQDFYEASLRVSLRHPFLTILVLAATILLNFYLFTAVQKGFFPQEDSGILFGQIRADQSISYQAMEAKFRRFVAIVHSDPAVEDVVGFTGGGGGGPRGGGSTNTGQVFVQLKPLSERKLTTDQILARMKPKFATVAGARLFLVGRQDVRAGGRSGNAQYQYTIEGDTLEDLNTWVPKITDALQNVNALEDVNSDQQTGGLEIELSIDRASAARLGIDPVNIDNTLYDAFGQRQVSTIYNELNQYHVVMEVAPAFWQSPETLNDLYISTSGGALRGTQASGAVAGTTVLTGAARPAAAAVAADAQRNAQLNAIANSARGGVSTGAAVSTAPETMIPLASIAHFTPGTTPLSINHQGPFVATTFSFNLPDNGTLGSAVSAIQRTMSNLHVPVSIHGEFAGTAQIFQQSLSDEPLLILAAILTVYIVLGILYESLVHPLTILSTLPSAGVGALAAIWYLRTDFSLVSLIGLILLIGIVKKNAIMMIDFAILAQRDEHLSPRDAIYRASVLRFRPIMMTTFAALLGALPLAVASGEGAELRKPLGIAIVGGLIVSQILTLYTTPVVYLYLERYRAFTKRGWDRLYTRLVGDAHAPAE
ncbi:MAG: efflux RND transporter permease subunit [Alphaproteobacteria bacterium]|nr:efflux RND transporter permease subunit [Alphaproteobacteria bacterium]